MTLQQQQVDASELFNLLESTEIKVVKEIKALIHENLNSTREAWLLNGLVEYYMATQCDSSLEILAGLREPHDKHLFDKLNDYMKGPTRVSTLTVIGFIVRKQPSWLHKIVNHHLFNSIIKCLKTDTDVPILMSACLIVTTLLPVVPVSIGSHLPDIFLVFTRLAEFSLKKPGLRYSGEERQNANVPDIFLLHLHVGVYALFHRLYGMYPCNFLAFLRDYYNKKDHIAMEIFEETIKPMLERVRMHPQLVTGSKQQEKSTSRWKRMEIHDITIECAKMSLDMIEGTAEGYRRPLFPMFGNTMSIDGSFGKEPPLDTQTQQSFPHHQPGQSMRGHEASDQYSLVNQSKCSSADLWSPSSVCGMTTPPLSQQLSPSQSVSDLNTASITSHQGFHGQTPTIPTPTMRNSPPYEDSGNYGSAKGKGRSVPLGHPNSNNHQCPVRSSGIDVSPMKKDFTTEPPNQAKKMVALLPTDKALETSKTCDSSAEVLLKLNGGVSEYGPKQENCDTTKAAEKEPSVTDSGKSLALHPSHSMPNIVDKSECDASSTSDKTSEDFQTASELSVNVDDPVPLEMLPKVIERLSESDSEDMSHVHDVDDDEVSDINRSQVSITIDHEPYDHSAKINDPQLTAQSMQQFMKNVNRIRFNSMNTNNDSTLKLSVKNGKHLRCNSCPDFGLKQENSDAFENGFDEEVEDNVESQVTEIVCEVATTVNECLPPPLPMSVAVTCESTTVTRSTTVRHIYPMTSAGVVQSLPHMQHNLPPPPPLPQQFPPFINTSHTEQLDQMPVTRLPYEHLFPLSLPFTPITQCQNCMDHSYVASDSNNQPHMTTTFPPKVLGSEVPLFTSLSPPELLDRQIHLGGEIHAKELSRIPLTSGENISWTHFGGDPPTDEVNILRGQNMLLHTQMMYERHKREQHAVRNRRLLGKIVKNVALEEQNSAMRDQLQLQEKDIELLQVSLKVEKGENRRISDEKKAMEFVKESELVKLRRSKEELEYKTKELQSMLVTEKEEKKIMLRELQAARSEFFNLNEEMKIIQNKVARTNDLQEQVKDLNTEVLLMGELQKKYREKMAALSKNDPQGFGQKQILEAHKTEIETLKSSVDQVEIHSQSLKTRVTDLEEVIKNKDVVITEQKRSLEKVKNVYNTKLESVNEKYRSQQNLITSLEAHVLELHHKYSPRRNRHSSHKSPNGSSRSQNTSRETSPEQKTNGASQKTNGASQKTRPITVRRELSLDQLGSSRQEVDTSKLTTSNNAHAPSTSNDYVTRNVTTDGETAFKKHQPNELNSYPQYSKPSYSNFTCASEGQRYDSMDEPSFLMPYDSVVKPPDDLEASAAESDMNVMIGEERDDFTSASDSNSHAQDGGASLNVDSGIVSHM